VTVLDRKGFLARYFDSPLTGEQRPVVELEGSIVGVG
jgi:hypothetical protein